MTAPATAHDAKLAQVRARAEYANTLLEVYARADGLRRSYAIGIANDVLAEIQPHAQLVGAYRVAQQRCVFAKTMLHLELYGSFSYRAVML